jgi:phosphoribosylformylglycinamidine synthase
VGLRHAERDEYDAAGEAQGTPHAPREGLRHAERDEYDAAGEAQSTPHAPREGLRHAERDEYDAAGAGEPIAIPPSLLISALGQIDDVRRSVSMDLKEPGNHLYLVGKTKNELGGSHFALVRGLSGGEVPKVDAAVAKATFAAIHRAIDAGLVRACHDLSEGGLAVAAAEMAFAGGLGARLRLDAVPAGDQARDTATLLFSESNTRFLCEVRPADAESFEKTLAGLPHARVGEVTGDGRFEIRRDSTVIDAPIDQLKRAWLEPLDW